ncbi:DUF4190 domain-containing protein [Promicromonospora soli]
MMDGREPVDGRPPEPAQDLGFAVPGSPASGTQPQATHVAPDAAAPASDIPGAAAPTYQAPLPYGPYAPAVGPGAPSNPQATASLVLGIVSLVLSVLFVPAIIGVVLGIVGLVRSGRTDPPTGRGAAIAGIVLSAVGATLGVVLVVTASTALSPLAEWTSEESASTTGDGDGDGSTGRSEAEVEAFDPDGYVTVDAAQWKSIEKHPGRAEGRAVVVFAEVVRFDSSTGPDRFLAVAGVDQPGAEFELQSSSVFIGEERLLDDVEKGDVLKVHAVVTGSLELETSLGGVSTVPMLTIAQVEDVGLADLSKDFALGKAERNQLGFISVPVTVTNSGGQTFTYSAAVVAESKDGKTSYGTGIVFVEDIKPGQKPEVLVDFFEEIPADAVFRVESAERYLE